MLQNFRDRLKGITAFILVGIIIIPFAFFGIDSLFLSGSAVEEAAQVNGEPINELRVQQATAIQRQQILERFEDIDPAVIDDEQLRGPALDALVRQEVVAQAARERGMAVADSAFNQIIMASPAFQEDGRFSRDLYEFSLQRMGYTPRSYRDTVIRELLMNQFVRGISISGFATGYELAELAQITQQERDFYYLTVATDAFADGVEIADAEVRAYYDDHPEKFRVPEQVVLEYISLKPESLLDRVEVDPQAVRRQFEEERDAARGAVRWHVAHILVEEKDDSSHRQRLEEVRQKLAQGEEFARLAKTYSEDPGSADQGGDLGTFSPGSLPPAFEAVLSELAEGEVSGVVETDSGLHLVKLIERSAVELPVFEEERERIRRQLARDIARERLPALVEALREQSYTAENLSAVGEALDLEVSVSEPLSQEGGGTGIGQYPQVVRAAFSEDVIKNGYASEVLEIADQHYIVVKLQDRRPAHRKPLDAVRDSIVADLRAEKAAAAARSRAETLLARIEGGESVEAVAREEGLDWQVALDARRFSGNADPRLVEAIFSHPLDTGLPVQGLVRDSNGNYRVYSLSQITPGALSDMPAQQRRGLRETLANMVTDREWQAYQAALRNRAEVEIR